MATAIWSVLAATSPCALVSGFFDAAGGSQLFVVCSNISKSENWVYPEMAIFNREIMANHDSKVPYVYTSPNPPYDAVSEGVSESS